MAYITNYTLSKLSKSLETTEKITEDIFVKHIYKDRRLHSFFTTWELKYLFNFKRILQDEKAHLKYFVQVPEERDTGTYVNEKSSKLKFHLDINCEFLVKNFTGFVIPPEVKQASLIPEFRRWFKANDFEDKLENQLITGQLIIMKYNREFAKKYGLANLNQGYKLVEEKPNSGYDEKVVSFNVDEFYNTIEQCVSYKRNALNCKEKRILGKWVGMLNKSDSEIKNKVIELLGVNFYYNYGLENIKDLWRSYSKVKNGILMKNLIEYFKWTYKANNRNYDKITLENFNMSCCGNCNETNNSRGTVLPEENDDLPF
tara:strand:+ start:8283 stop:9227 length:945 start_codon:yes stop_codon:yes gene_type:complete